MVGAKWAVREGFDTGRKHPDGATVYDWIIVAEFLTCADAYTFFFAAVKGRNLMVCRA